MDKPEDHGAGDVNNSYCKYCTDAQGQLLPRETVRQNMIQFFAKTMGKSEEEAAAEVEKVMARMPAWSEKDSGAIAPSEPVVPVSEAPTVPEAQTFEPDKSPETPVVSAPTPEPEISSEPPAPEPTKEQSIEPDRPPTIGEEKPPSEQQQ